MLGKIGSPPDPLQLPQNFLLVHVVMGASCYVFLVVRDRPRGHVLLTGQGIRGRIPQAEHVDHDEWLQVGLSVIISNPPTHTRVTFVPRG